MGCFYVQNPQKRALLIKNKQEHPPILLRSTKQKGKSFLVEKFTKNLFQNIAIIDFEYKSKVK